MIKVSKMADYAMLVIIALVKAKQPQSAAQVAEDIALPLPTIRKILKLLLQCNLLRSSRGAQGGYELVHSAEQLTVAQVIEAVDGPIALTECNIATNCNRSHFCEMKKPWQKVNQMIRTNLTHMSIADMVGESDGIETS